MLARVKKSALHEEDKQNKNAGIDPDAKSSDHLAPLSWQWRSHDQALTHPSPKSKKSIWLLSPWVLKVLVVLRLVPLGLKALGSRSSDLASDRSKDQGGGDVPGQMMQHPVAAVEETFPNMGSSFRKDFDVWALSSLVARSLCSNGDRPDLRAQKRLGHQLREKLVKRNHLPECARFPA